ncbi:hypothetical protein GSbR_29030 [Geobacter sp. SVR]|nr:hypothetical protein GSbR_29030 [Geobacter sp. SVR]
MSVSFPEVMLTSFLSFLGIKERQSPSLSREEMVARSKKIFQQNVDLVSSVYDRLLPSCDSPRAAISATLSSLRKNYSYFSYESVKISLRYAGRLKGTGL